MGTQIQSPHRKVWFSEYPRKARDELLTSYDLHEELVGLYPWSPNAHEAIHERVFAGYVLIERLDDGNGTGMVFIAITDPAVCPLEKRRAVCIKIPNLSRGSGPGDQAVESVTNEIEILRELDSSPMVDGLRPRYLDCGYFEISPHKPLPYLITEYIAFLTPFQNYSNKASIATWIKISRAFQELHAKGIVHGDIYERNIFFTGNGQPVILDFGSARRISWLRFRAERPLGFFPPDCPTLDEIAMPNQRIRCAFDVACLAATFRRSASQLNTNTVPNTANQELRKLFGMCVRNEPEYRPQNAGKLADYLRRIVENKTVSVKPITLAMMRSLYRRYPAIVWPTLTFSILMIASSIFLSLKWQSELQKREQEKIHNQQLLASAEAKEQALTTMFRAMQVMLKSTIALDEAQIPTQTDGKASRRTIAIELAQIVQAPDVSESTRLSALQLLIDTARGHLEVDGVEFAEQCVSRARAAMENSGIFFDSSSSTYQCLNVQLMAFQSSMTIRSISADADKSRVFHLAKKAVEMFLAIRLSPGATAEQRRLLVETGIDVLGHAVYPFPALDWRNSDKAEATESVFLHAVEPFQNRAADAQHHLPLARINYIYALLIHKSYIARLVNPHIELQAAFVREYISASRAYLQQLSDDKVDIASSSKREIDAIVASLSTLAGLSFSLTAELDDAREELGKALQHRKLQVAKRPGSIRAIRELISTAWALSDTFFSQARVACDSTDLHSQSIPMRQFAVNECRRLYQADPDKDARIAYQVNQIRLSFAQILCGQENDAITGLKMLDELASLEDPGTQHTLGDDVYICLAHLQNAYPEEPRYVERMNKQADLLVSRLNEARKKNGTLRVQTIEAQIDKLLILLKSPQFSALAKEESWSSIVQACESGR